MSVFVCVLLHPLPEPDAETRTGRGGCRGGPRSPSLAWSDVPGRGMCGRTLGAVTSELLPQIILLNTSPRAPNVASSTIPNAFD